MGRRPKFCPPLLSNRCAGIEARHSSSPWNATKSCMASSSSGNHRMDSMSPRVVRDAEFVSEVVPKVGGRAVKERQVRKRNSPRTTLSPRVAICKSPLSRMMLSPALRALSPLSSQGASSSAAVNERRGGLMELDLNIPICSNIDLNADPEEQVNLTDDLDHGQAAHEDLGAPPAQINEYEKRTEVPDHTRKAIVEFLLAKSKNGYLKGHETGEASAAFSVHIRTVQRIWHEAKGCLDQGVEINVSSKKSKRGRKKMLLDVSKLREVPIASRGTLDDVSRVLECSKSKARSMQKEGTIVRVSNTLKPFLTDMNKMERLRWCISMLDPRSVPHDPVFKAMYDFVVLDEKWFNLTRKTQRIYMAPDEPKPVRTSKNKNFIPKIMFVCALARPRFDSEGRCTFDGKIGCFPFVTYEAAKRSSKNRPAGTIEMKPIDSIKMDVNRAYLIDKILPEIRRKWPREDAHKTIYIQQDNAPSHVGPDDDLFCEVAQQNGFDIRLKMQPANSPDLNILDLGFFSSIQSIQYKTSSRSTEELVTVVGKAFDDYPPCKANKIFLSLHACMEEVIKVGGSMNYNVPHLKKEILEREGRLPVQLKCDAALVEAAIAKISDARLVDSAAPTS